MSGDHLGADADPATPTPLRPRPALKCPVPFLAADHPNQALPGGAPPEPGVPGPQQRAGRPHGQGNSADIGRQARENAALLMAPSSH